jgi:hypothetical protein
VRELGSGQQFTFRPLCIFGLLAFSPQLSSSEQATSPLYEHRIRDGATEGLQLKVFEGSNQVTRSQNVSAFSAT